MCGICGVIDRDRMSIADGMDMVNAMVHRGPDAQEVKLYQKNDCMLGHARLSIIDLSTGANQPLEYKQYVIVFNGEIYNFREIKTELLHKGHKFLLESDTEVIVHAFAEWGNDCVSHFIGMFAFAILDRDLNRLTIVRDRAGVKPLYYYVNKDLFMFGSELKVFYHYPKFEKCVRKASVGMYFKYGYVPAPYSIYEKTWKLMPGHILEYDITARSFSISKYWDVMDYYKRPRLSLSYAEAQDELEHILTSAFNYRMVADVPVGVFLSGGYDSALLTTLLQKGRSEKLKTFTIGFADKDWDESQAAYQLAQYLGTDHTEYICSQEDCKAIIPELPLYYDEPFADNSAVPTILVSKLARQQVKVALSADGGDETFAGYNRYAGLYGIKKPLQVLNQVKSPLLSKMSRRVTGVFLKRYSFLHEKGETLSKIIALDAQYRIAYAAECGSFSTLSESVYHEICSMDFPDPMFLLDERDYDDAISVATAMDYINYMLTIF